MSKRGWGSSRSERTLFTWFASRPVAQAKAAVICSLLPWPDDKHEQKRLKDLVRKSMTGYDAANPELKAELCRYYPDGARLLDSFSGRGIIPLEAARLGVRAQGIDYSPVATLAGQLLADYPMRNWNAEPPLRFPGYPDHAQKHFHEPRMLRDVRFVLELIGDRHKAAMGDFYPTVNGNRPWGYLWAVTVPCVGCSWRFPLTGNLTLRADKKNDPGQSYVIQADPDTGIFTTVVHDGPPSRAPTLIKIPNTRGKTAVCCFCGQRHPLETVKRLMRDGFAGDALMAVADLDKTVGKRYRVAVRSEIAALDEVEAVLADEPDFATGLAAVPTEVLTSDLASKVNPAGYGYRSYGELCNPRQTLGFVRLARTINTVAQELRSGGSSPGYTAALTGYAASNLVRLLKYGTRGARLRVSQQIADIFANEGSISFSFDYFETGLGGGAGTWPSLIRHTFSALGKQLARAPGQPASIARGSAMSLPLADGSLDAVVIDPPYDAMINYTDSSDLLFAWLKRALVTSHPWFGMTSHPHGLQEKTFEAVIKFGKLGTDHRTPAHYERCIAEAFEQARRKITPDGVVTLIFGHGDPDVWHRLLAAVKEAGLVLTGSWPARTELASGPGQGDSNIETTLTLACRSAAAERPQGRVVDVDAEVRRAVLDRVPQWETDGLAISDQLMASAGPAMEVVGRYIRVLDHRGIPVELDRYLPLARRFVQEAADIKIDGRPLRDFDSRSQFALFWVRQHERSIAAASEARWQCLASDLTVEETTGLLVKRGKGVRFAYATEHADHFAAGVSADSTLIDTALYVAGAGPQLGESAKRLARLGRSDDELLWAAMAELSRLLGESDADGAVWTWLVRNRSHVRERAGDLGAVWERRATEQESQDRQSRLFGE